jgi:peptidyl-prolyl cis-trans isomerase D
VFKANKDEILGPIETDFGYHVIKVTDIRPEKVKTLDEARPEIEGELKKQEANQKFADVSQKFTDVVFTQPSSLKAASEATGISPKVSPFFSKQFAPVPVLNNPKLLGEIFADDVKKNGKNTSAVEVQPNVLVAARVLEAKPAVTRTFDEVKVGIEAKLTREAQTRLATEEGEAKLKDLREGKAVAGLSWPAELSVSRDKPGGLPPDLVDKVLRADANKVPVYVGGSGPGGGYALVRISKVNEVAIDDAKRKTYEERARSSRQGAEFATLLNSLRQTADISVRRELIEKKAATP